MRPDGRKLTLSGIGYAPYTHAQAWAIVLICCEVLLEPGCDEWQWFHAFFLLRTGPERLFQKGFCLPETGPIRIGNGFGYSPKNSSRTGYRPSEHFYRRGSSRFRTRLSGCPDKFCGNKGLESVRMKLPASSAKTYICGIRFHITKLALYLQ